MIFYGENLDGKFLRERETSTTFDVLLSSLISLSISAKVIVRKVAERTTDY